MKQKDKLEKKTRKSHIKIILISALSCIVLTGLVYGIFWAVVIYQMYQRPHLPSKYIGTIVEDLYVANKYGFEDTVISQNFPNGSNTDKAIGLLKSIGFQETRRRELEDGTVEIKMETAFSVHIATTVMCKIYFVANDDVIVASRIIMSRRSL